MFALTNALAPLEQSARVGSLLAWGVKRRSIAPGQQAHTACSQPAGPSFNCAISSFNQSRHTMRNERVLGILRPTMKFFRATHKHKHGACARDCDCIYA
jgi:hypothetical protein